MHRSYLTTYALAFAGCLTLAGCGMDDWGNPVHGSFDQTVALDPAGDFSLENVNGEITVDVWDQNSVHIEADKGAPSESILGQIRIEVRGQGDRVEVRTRLPQVGLFGGGRGNVTYHIHLPGKAHVEIQTVNGALRVNGVNGPIRATTVNGSVKIADAQRDVTAQTVNGSIDSSFKGLAESGRNGFSTTNGSVTLTLPGDATGDFEARTVNGGITTDFPLEVTGTIGSHHLRGRIGQGGPSFHVNTVNGGVKLRKGEEGIVWLRHPYAGRPFHFGPSPNVALKADSTVMAV